MVNSSAPDPWGNEQQPAGARGPSGWQSSTQDGAAPSWGTSTSPAGWNSSGPPAAPRALVRPPYVFLWIAFGAALLALALSVAPGGLLVAVPAWILAGFIGFGASVMFVQRDARRQAEVFYARDPRAPWLYRFAIALSFLAVVAAALRIALIVGRMG